MRLESAIASEIEALEREQFTRRGDDAIGGSVARHEPAVAARLRPAIERLVIGVNPVDDLGGPLRFQIQVLQQALEGATRELVRPPIRSHQAVQIETTLQVVESRLHYITRNDLHRAIRTGPALRAMQRSIRIFQRFFQKRCSQGLGRRGDLTRLLLRGATCGSSNRQTGVGTECVGEGARDRKHDERRQQRDSVA